MKHFTASAEKVLNKARETSALSGCPFTGSEHVLCAMLQTEDCIAYKLLSARGITEHSVKKHLPDALPFVSRVDGGEGYSVRLRHIIESSAEQASRHGSEKTGTEHILLCMISEDECTAARLITAHGVKLSEIFSDITSVIGSRSSAKGRHREKESGYLKQYGKDLCALYEDNKLFPCIGRKEECEQLIRILCRKTKNDPCLIGEAGVGKTAVAEGVAALLSEGRVPPALYGKTVVSVDITSVLAGSKYRGDFEERFRGIINECISRGDVILFIDEIHMLSGAGAAEGAVDAANIIKQPLGRGEITVIGATTFSEYEKYIESDPALCRRFQPVIINEPDEELACRMLTGIRPILEKHHGVIITDNAVQAAVRLSHRYIKNRYLPDKAIDLLDEASADVLITPKERLNGILIDEEDIKKTLCRYTYKQQTDERFCFAMLESKLNERIYGQIKAMRLICAYLIRKSAGFGSAIGPRASFIFTGPAGTGKTETCRALAEYLTNNNSLLCFDLSEYTEPHAVSSLTGAPPGYVGHTEGGRLTEGVRRAPYSVVCFENADKAHPDIYGMLHRILEEGTLTDAKGRITDFSGTIVILTVSEQTQKRCVGGFAGQRAETKYLSSLPSSLTDRIGRIIEFEPLDDNALLKIIKNRLSYIKGKCGFSFSYTESSLSALLSKCDRSQGGLGALKAVEEYIEEPVSYLMLGEGLCGINVNSDKKDIQITSVKSLDKTAVSEYN